MILTHLCFRILYKDKPNECNNDRVTVQLWMSTLFTPDNVLDIIMTFVVAVQIAV